MMKITSNRHIIEKHISEKKHISLQKPQVYKSIEEQVVKQTELFSFLNFARSRVPCSKF